MQKKIIIAVLAGLIPSLANAGAWTQAKGAGQLITGASIYQTSRLFNVSGNKQAQPTFYKQELSAYGEYGLYDDVTLGGQLAFSRAHQNNFTSYNLGDTELFVRQRVWKNEKAVLSLQPYVIIPSPDKKTTTPKIGADHPSAGLRAGYGRNFEMFGKWHYFDVSAAYQYRFGAPSDQLKLDVTTGINITDRWQVIPQAFATKSTKKPRAAGGLPNLLRMIMMC